MAEDELEFDTPLRKNSKKLKSKKGGIRYLQIKAIPKSSHFTTSGNEENS